MFEEEKEEVVVFALHMIAILGHSTEVVGLRIGQAAVAVLVIEVICEAIEGRHGLTKIVHRFVHHEEHHEIIVDGEEIDP